MQKRQAFQWFFPLTAAGALIALTPWLTAAIAPSHAHFGIHFHALAMLNLTAGAAFAGFLFTALPEWTGCPFAVRRHLPALTLLLAAGTCQLHKPAAACALYTGFWAYLTLICTALIIRAKDRRQISLIIILAAITALNARLSYHGVTAGRLWQLLDIITAAISLTNFRIARALGSQALQDAGDTRQFLPNPIYKNSSVICLCLLAAADTHASAAAAGWLALAAGLTFCARLHDWHAAVLLRRHYVRAHYAVTAAAAAGYLSLGWALLAAPAAVTALRHLIAISVMLGMILLTLAIAGLRHSGLELRFAWRTRTALLLLFAAGIIRSAGYLLYPAALTLFILPAVCTAVGFLLYLSIYLPLFWRGAK